MDYSEFLLEIKKVAREFVHDKILEMLKDGHTQEEIKAKLSEFWEKWCR